MRNWHRIEQLQKQRAELLSKIGNIVNSLAVASDDQTRRELDQRIRALRADVRELDAQLAQANRPETFVDFAKRHGGNPIGLKPRDGLRGSSQTLLFPDGASWVRSSMGTSAPSEPPDDPVANLAARRRYAELALDEGETAFEKLKALAVHEADPANDRPLSFDHYNTQWRAWYGNWTGDYEADLKQLRKVVKQLRNKLKGIDAEPLAVNLRKEQEAQQRAHAQAQIESRQRAYDRVKRLSEISIDS